MALGSEELLYFPVAVWAATAIGLGVAFRRSGSPWVLRLAAIFLGLWALLATTVLVWVVSNGGWRAIVRLAANPSVIFRPASAVAWLDGAAGALLVLAVAFALNQLVGRGLLRILRPHPIPWPSTLPVPRTPTSLLAFASARPEAFSFALVEISSKGPPRVRRREIILLSRGLLERLTVEEREAVIAHERAHLADLDGRYLTYVRTFARMMRWDPLVRYVASALTRQAERRADLEAVEVTRRPLALARALYKSTLSSAAIAPGVSAGLLGGGGRPEVLERIRRLVALADSGRYAEEPSGPP